MKKLLLLIILSALLLSGCGTESASNVVANPYEIKVGDKTLSLYDSTKEDFEENGFEVYESTDDPIYITYDVDYSDWNNYIAYRDWGSDVNEIACVYIFDDSVVTYKSISVGDNIDKLKKNFYKLFVDEDDIYKSNVDAYGYLRYNATFFNSKGEEVFSLKELDENEKGTHISYYTDKNDIIVLICICDAKMAKVGI